MSGEQEFACVVCGRPDADWVDLLGSLRCPEHATAYGWGWIDGEDDDEGKAWIQISSLDEYGFLGEEMAVIMCRNFARVRAEHPEWIAQREQAARLIVAGLNERGVAWGAEP